MAKKTSDNRPIPKDDPSRILQTTVEDVMHQSMIPYAEHVILERALPRVEDGLKPVQRRILYTMMELGTTPDKPHRKCARIVGDCLGKYHPHGDSSVYDALVRMAQDFSMRGPMVDGHGNFGSIDGDSAAAMRYTEARMTPLALEMLRDIEKDTVPFRLNFDDTLKEPDMLPARFPNLLVNGASGIAVGLATNIPPHNLGESIRAAIAVMENPDIPLDELMKIIPGPDFPTGGVLVKNEEIRRGYETGRSKLSLRARVHVEDGVNGRKLLVITEIPYMVNKAAMLEKILKLSEEKKGQLQNIYDIRDESDREGMRAVIELKKDADPDKVLKVLYKYSDLQVTFGVNMVAIAEGKPVQMGLKTMLGHFIRHQKNVITRRTEYDLKQAKARAHILQGLMIAVDNLDEVIALIRSSKNPKEAKARLMERFSLSDAQAQAILDMRLQRLTNLEIIALRKEYEDILKLIDRLEGILHSEKKLLAVIRKELQEIAEEFADERRTTIEKADESPLEVEEEAAAPEEVAASDPGGGRQGVRRLPVHGQNRRDAAHLHRPRQLLSPACCVAERSQAQGSRAAAFRRAGRAGGRREGAVDDVHPHGGHRASAGHSLHHPSGHGKTHRRRGLRRAQQEVCRREREGRRSSADNSPRRQSRRPAVVHPQRPVHPLLARQRAGAGARRRRGALYAGGGQRRGHLVRAAARQRPNRAADRPRLRQTPALR